MGSRAQLESANVDVNATLIRTPIAGRVGNKTVTIGQYAQSGTRLMSLVPLSKLYIVANSEEARIGLMRVSQTATITVDALDGVELRRRLVCVSPGTGSQFSLLPLENATAYFIKIVQRVPIRIAVGACLQNRKLLVPARRWL